MSKERKSILTFEEDDFFPLSCNLRIFDLMELSISSRFPMGVPRDCMDGDIE